MRFHMEVPLRKPRLRYLILVFACFTMRPLCAVQASQAGASGPEAACTVRNRGGQRPKFWTGGKGEDVLLEHDAAWRKLMKTTFHLALPNKPQAAFEMFRKWMLQPGVQPQLAALALSIAYGDEDGGATVEDPVRHDRATLSALVTRVSALAGSDAEAYKGLLERLNDNKEMVTPSNPSACGKE